MERLAGGIGDSKKNKIADRNKMNEKFLNLNINDRKSLLLACDYLHDARLDISKIIYDENEGLWQAQFERQYFEDPSMMEYHKKLLVFYKISYPIVGSKISLRGIKEYKINTKSKMPKYTFNECKIKNNIFRFEFIENLDVQFIFDENPIGRLTDQFFLKDKGQMFSLGKPKRW